MTKRVSASKNGSKTSKKRKVSRVRVPRSLFGNSTTTTLKYVEALQLNPGVAGVPATYVFSANGLFDPNITGIGHQPRGFDEIKPLFDHYLVKSSTIKVTFLQGGSQIVSHVCGVMLQDDATAESNMIEAMEGRTNSYGALSINGGPLTCNLSFNSSSFFNRAKGQKDLLGAAGSNPADQAYFVIFTQPTYAVDSNACDVVVEINYLVEWSEPNNLAAS